MEREGTPEGPRGEVLIQLGLTPAELAALAAIHHHIDAAIEAMECAFRESKNQDLQQTLRGGDPPSEMERATLLAINRFYLRTIEILSTHLLYKDSPLLPQLRVRQRSFIEALEQLGQHIPDTLHEERRKLRERAVAEHLVDSKGEFLLDLGPNGSMRVKRNRLIVQKLLRLAREVNADLFENFVTHPLCLKKADIVPWYQPHHLDEGEQWITLGEWLRNEEL